MTRRTAFLAPTAFVALAAIAAGCARHAAAPKPVARPAAVKATVPLPDWAPKDPSPEFLRAWKVLKPTPDSGARDPERLALAARAARTWAAAYEFFGTLTDEQLKRFLAERVIRMPVKSLSGKQRAALDRWFASWRREMKGQTSLPDDWHALLYKLGAQPDLSNVDVGFDAQFKGQRVHTKFWVRRPGGQEAEVANDFANL